MTDILVVDDEIEICRALEKFLEKEGHTVRTATNGDDAVMEVKKSAPDVVLLDIKMPGKNGDETLTEIVEIDKNIVVIMLTAIDDIDTVLSVMKKGASDFMSKPVILAEVRRSIHSALEKKRLILENQQYQDKLEEMVAQKTIQLRDAEERLRGITESANDAIIMLNSNGTVTFWNPAAELMYGYCAEEIIGEKLTEYIVPATYRERHDNGLANFKIDGQGSVIGKTVELSAVRKNGQEFPIELSLAAVKIQREWHAVGVTRDITTRKKAEEKLRLNQDRLSRIVETIAEGLYIVDAKGRIVFANKASLKLFGLEKEELYKRTYNDSRWNIRNSRGEPINEEDYPFVKVKNTGKPVYGIELIAPQKDDKELIISINAAPMYGPDGAFQGMVATQDDITENKLAERALIKANRENEQLLTALPSIMISLNRDRCILKWNSMAEKAFGLKCGKVVNTLFYDHNIKWEWDKIKSAMDKCEGKSKAVELDNIRYTRADGKEGFIDLTINPVRNESNKVEGFLLLGVDITEKRILESHLTQAQKLESIGSLAAGIAHEINTPTQFVGDNIHFLEEAFRDIQSVMEKYSGLVEECESQGEKSKLLGEIREINERIDIEFLTEEIPKAIESSLKGVERVTTIVRAMKDFSHPGSKERVLVDINNSIQSTITVARNEWKYVANMETQFDPSLKMVPCYPDAFNQVILNLITNAAHAIGDVIRGESGKKGEIGVITKKENDWAVITITDNGGGVPNSIKDKLFDHFFTTKEVGKGTGQGLAISRAIIVEKHGGAISFDSKEGEGTTFTVKIPLVVKG
ncbi:hypothetical protein MNBD_NITROSPINAE02-425 [hydrothermal vent metagenome]|uniref:Uncharacterized protein n=1 Tax=hydrothermal vent metagenome TaxID=652676 RepID=A0A3B1C6U8_9ZZZZ